MLAITLKDVIFENEIVVEPQLKQELSLIAAGRKYKKLSQTELGDKLVLKLFASLLLYTNSNAKRPY